MDRDELSAIFYGADPVPPAWATDCPVRFDVWYAFAQPRPEGLARRVDLILAINEEHGLANVLATLRQWPNAQPIASGSFVAAKLALRELVAMLTMTSLWRQVSLAQQIPNLLQVLQSPALGVSEDIVQPAIPIVDEEERQVEINQHLGWFLRLLRSVAEAETDTNVPGAGAFDVADMLQKAPLPATPQPPGARGKVIDRRRRYPIVSITTNRQASAAITRSRTTIKADAAEQLFSVDCSNIGWAVVDSGIDVVHPAFGEWDISLAQSAINLGTRVVRVFDVVNAREALTGDMSPNGLIDWTKALPWLEMNLPMQSAPSMEMQLASQAMRPYAAPVDRHGTHVAGILGASWPEREFRGICPTIRLYDFRVLDAQGRGDEFSIVAALQAIRYINEQSGRLAIAGVNLSLAVPHDVAAYTAGWTPVCVECDKLVRSGVVVVTAAGNAGFKGAAKTLGAGYNTVSISDPGNTDSVITVGATHRSDPHRHGVSYFSSRGPTADGRRKPDILAPGEDIDGPIPGGGISAMHGTSQAAAHVSGAAAMLIARYRELLGRPDRVKQILCSTATDLGREPSFQGNGLVDVLRAMQSI